MAGDGFPGVPMHVLASAMEAAKGERPNVKMGPFHEDASHKWTDLYDDFDHPPVGRLVFKAVWNASVKWNENSGVPQEQKWHGYRRGRYSLCVGRLPERKSPAVYMMLDNVIEAAAFCSEEKARKIMEAIDVIFGGDEP